MKFFTLLAFGVSVALATCQEPSTSSSRQSRRSSTGECSQKAIDECITSTELDGPTCFAHICTSIQDADLRRRAKEDDEEEEAGFKVASDNTPASCTEDNLLDCAVAQWRNPDVCFQQLCLE